MRLLLLAAIWGSSFLFIKIGVESVPAVPMTTLRIGLAAVLMMALARTYGEWFPTDRRLWPFILLAGLFGNALPFTLISWGEERIDSGLAAILMAPMPLTTLVLAHLFTEEKLNTGKLAGVILGILGLVVLIGPDSLTRLGEDTVRQLAVAAAGCCYAVNAVASKWLTGGSRIGMAAAVMVASTLFMAPLSLLEPSDWLFAPTPASVAAIVVLAVMQTAIGTLLMLGIVARQGASFFSQINFLIPLFGVMWGALVLAERPSPNAVVALALILAGVAVARRAVVQGR
ncbi:MAG TPA: DMT family transporter [Hyphomicrobiaceae bacterium]|nr:DMT family transporter [Hyphomicrobiaceae bacterium]